MIAQILILYLLIILIASLIKHHNIKLVIVLILTTVVVFELISLTLTDTFIDYRFYTHFKIESIKDFGVLFIKEIIIFLILYIVSVYFIMKASDILSKKKMNLLYKVASAALFIAVLWQDNGIIQNLFDIYRITHVEKKTFNESLKSLNIDPNAYILPENIKAVPGKNIIVISVESLEQGFFSKHFPNLLPHLHYYSDKWTFFQNMPVAPGSGWTAGSLYTHQVGVPAFVNMEDKSFKSKNGYINEEGKGNNIFQGIRDNKLVGLGTIFQKAGYDYRYLMGNIEFAGVEDLLQSYGYQTISQKNTIGKYKPIVMGLNDLDLFHEAKLQIDALSQHKTKPFALFMSTINTHFPIGIYDERMEQYVPKRDDPLEFSIASVDYLIHDFIQYLQKKDLLKDTAIFIFPDHLLMGRGGDIHQRLNMQPRQLYLLTNVKPDKFKKQTTDSIYQVDIPRFIIDGAEIKTNAKFLFDLIDTNDTIQFIEDNNLKITALNAAAIEKKNFKDEISIELKGEYIYVRSGENEIVSKVSDKSLLYDYMFSQDMVFLNETITLYKNRPIFQGNMDDDYYRLLHLIVKTKSQKINMAYLGNRQHIGLVKFPQEEKKVVFKKEEVENIVSSHKYVYQYRDSLIRKVDNNVCKEQKDIFVLENENLFNKYNLTIEYDQKSDRYKMTALNNDPFILINTLNTRFNKVLLKYIVTNDIDHASFQIFYKDDKNGSYTEDESVSIKLKKGNNEIYLLIPSKYIENKLRIDISNRSGEYRVKELSLVDCKTN